MAKLFVISDVHGYYDEMRAALDAAGFDENNKEHWLIGCGDYIDRGEQPQEVINYLENLPRKILVKGNHEELLKELLDSREPTSYAFALLNLSGCPLTKTSKRPKVRNCTVFFCLLDKSSTLSSTSATSSLLYGLSI